jgi:hypothetical protein
LSRDLPRTRQPGRGEYYERSGHLEFVHSVTGLRTLKDEFDKVASHNARHLDQIRAALGEPAPG